MTTHDALLPASRRMKVPFGLWWLVKPQMPLAMLC